MIDTPPWDRLTANDLDPKAASSWLAGLGFNRAAPANVLLSLLDIGQTGFLARGDLPPAILDTAVVHEDSEVRAAAAESGLLTDAQWDRLIAATSDSRHRELFTEEQRDTRQRVPGRRGVGRPPHPGATPPATPEEIAAMAAAAPDIDPRDRTTALWWIGALHDDAEAMRLLATSSNLLIRRSVARAQHLPADVVAVLAGAPDRVVRLFLAESCDDAPPEMLLEVASWWHGSLSFPGRPRNHPNFPRDGLVRYATDPNPLLRALALDDPAATAAIAEQLGLDPHWHVRQAAAGDPRLSPASIRRLAADPRPRIRRLACTNPSIHADDLVTLLLDSGSAGHAVRNPAVPVPVMAWMVAVGDKLMYPRTSR
ncbi:hypothetical protein [Actinoplanes subglobosus]|uniref:Leucine rich repeat variant n=1 Tax=Actinoplanes subglobosus TaxID=1547892 RepID=A0ABV8J475_9ACTN